MIIGSEVSPENNGKYDRSRPIEKGLEQQAFAIQNKLTEIFIYLSGRRWKVDLKVYI